MSTTITLDEATKARLARLKGDATWNDYLSKIADIYPPDDVLRELADRMAELEEGRAKPLAWVKVRDRFA